MNLTIKTRSQKTETVVRRCSFLGQLDSRMPVECFPLPYDLSGVKSKIDGHLFRFFINRFPACFNLFVLIFLLIPCLVVSLQPCSEWTPVKKKKERQVMKLRKIATRFLFFTREELHGRCILVSIVKYLKTAIIQNDITEQNSYCTEHLRTTASNKTFTTMLRHMKS